MPLDTDYLRKLVLPSVEFSIQERDAMLYAVSLGLGADPLDETELCYTYEKNLKVFPTMATVLPSPPWLDDPRTGITVVNTVHASERLESYGELVAGRPLVANHAITGMLDKRDKGAIIVTERRVVDKATGKLVARTETQMFCRADGNFGESTGVSPQFRALPDRAADQSIDVDIEPSRALLYRLNGDSNPLHCDPQFARAAGFDRPILHGLCTYGVTAVALTRAFPGATLRLIEARMARPVFPGCTLTVDLWDDGDGQGGLSFRVRNREHVVLDRGRAVLG